MFLKLRPLLYSLVYFLGLEMIVFFHRHVFSIVILIFILAVYQGRISGGRLRFSVLPAIFSLSSVALLYLVTGRMEQQIFILITASMYYLSLFGAYRLSLASADQTALGMNMASSAAAAFFAFAGAYGLYLNFLVPLWSLMAVYLFVAFFLSFQYFILLKQKDPKTVLIYSLILAFSMSQIAWTINYWPFGYLTTGAVALILYYILWDIARGHFLGILSKKRTMANLIFFGACVFLVLVTSKWTPVI